MFSRKVRKAKFMKILNVDLKMDYLIGTGDIDRMILVITLEDAKGSEVKLRMSYRSGHLLSQASWFRSMQALADQVGCRSEQGLIAWLSSGHAVGYALKVSKISYYGMHGENSRNSWYVIVK